MRIISANDAMVLAATEAAKSRFWMRVRKTRKCWLFVTVASNAYGLFTLNKKNMYAHRVSMLWHHGAPMPHLLVCHKCTSKNCVRPSHLYWGTEQQNADDRSRERRQRWKRPGSMSSNATIDERIAADIYRAVLRGGVAARDIAKKFKVSKNIVDLIAEGQRWTHVTELMGPIDLSRSDRGNTKGSLHHKSKLNEQMVVEIKCMLREGYSISELARIYKMTKGTIWQISDGRQWAHVKLYGTKPLLKAKQRANYSYMASIG